jgi:hypothetical protein
MGQPVQHAFRVFDRLLGLHSSGHLRAKHAEQQRHYACGATRIRLARTKSSLSGV